MAPSDSWPWEKYSSEVIDDYKTNYKGQWSASDKYKRTHMVERDGELYICKNGNLCSFTEEYYPGTGKHWQDAWEFVADKGSTLAVREEIVPADESLFVDRNLERAPVVVAKDGLADNQCYVDKYIGNNRISIYCTKKQVNLSNSKIIITTNIDEQHLSLTVRTSLSAPVKAVTDGQVISFGFGDSYRAGNVDIKKNDISNLRKQLVKNNEDLLKADKIEDPKQRDIRVKDLNAQIKEKSGRISLWENQYKLMNVDVILNPNIPVEITFEGLPHGVNINQSTITKIELVDGESSVEIPVVAKKVVYPDYIKEFGSQADASKIGLVKLFVKAANNDPALSSKIDKTGKTDFEIAKEYYNALFFPSQDTYDIFSDKEAYQEFLSRKHIKSF